MFKLNSKGDLIASNGFDGGSYQPRYASRTSVFLGDMTREDIRIKKEVQARQAAEARLDLAARRSQAAQSRQRMLVKDYLAHKNRQVEARGAKMESIAKDQGFLSAYSDSQTPDFNPWMGNPFSGFGSGETRINPDSAQDVEIVDASIASVSEYGVQNWGVDPDSLVDRVNDSEWSQTEGKEILQTLVDYPQRPSQSVVGMPVPSMVSTELRLAQDVEAAESFVQPEKPNYMKLGLIGLGIFLVLR